MNILGIETSCDETAASVIEGKRVETQIFVSVRSNVVSSQIDLHKKYGGVVPEVAAREHVLNILPVVNEALKKSGVPPPLTPPPLRSLRERGSVPKKRVPPPCDVRSGREARRGALDAIAVTLGPGLITSLIIGIETAKTLSYAWDVPVIGVNHIEGHIYANFINGGSGGSLRSEEKQRTKRC